MCSFFCIDKAKWRCRRPVLRKSFSTRTLVTRLLRYAFSTRSSQRALPSCVLSNVRPIRCVQRLSSGWVIELSSFYQYKSLMNNIYQANIYIYVYIFIYIYIYIFIYIYIYVYIYKYIYISVCVCVFFSQWAFSI